MEALQEFIRKWNQTRDLKLDYQFTESSEGYEVAIKAGAQLVYHAHKRFPQFRPSDPVQVIKVQLQSALHHEIVYELAAHGLNHLTKQPVDKWTLSDLVEMCTTADSYITVKVRKQYKEPFLWQIMFLRPGQGDEQSALIQVDKLDDAAIKLAFAAFCKTYVHPGKNVPNYLMVDNPPTLKKGDRVKILEGYTEYVGMIGTVIDYYPDGRIIYKVEVEGVEDVLELLDNQLLRVNE